MKIGRSISTAIAAHAAAVDPHGDRAYTDTEVAAIPVPLTIAETEVFSGTSPTEWTDLDLSGVVGSNLALVLLKIGSTGNPAATAVRKDGETDEFWSDDSSVAAVAYGAAFAKIFVGIHAVVIVATSAAGIIEWKTDAAVATTIDIIAYIK